MKEPEHILESGTRIRTHEKLDSTTGLLITDRHLKLRRPNAVGVIGGIVGGHGGDVYFVAHIGDPSYAVYCFVDFELEPASAPVCTHCKGTGIDFPASAASQLCTACSVCRGTATTPPSPPPTVWERIQADEVP